MREHNNYWYLTEIFNLKNPAPALNGEPYYAGYRTHAAPDQRTIRAEQRVARSRTMSSSGQHVREFPFRRTRRTRVRAEGIWGADIEPECAGTHVGGVPVALGSSDAISADVAFQSAGVTRISYRLPTWCLPIKRMSRLGTRVGLLRTHGRQASLSCLFRKGIPQSQIRGSRLNSVYRAQWFNPRDGSWRDAGAGKLVANKIGIIVLPTFPATRIGPPADLRWPAVRQGRQLKADAFQ